MLSKREAFKVAFLEKCAMAGLSMEETAELAQESLAKAAGMTESLMKSVVNPVIDGAGSLLSGAASTAANLGTAGAIGLPIAGGAALGYGAAQLTNANQEDPEEVKVHELINEYRRMTEQARLNHAARASQANFRPGRPLIR